MGENWQNNNHMRYMYSMELSTMYLVGTGTGENTKSNTYTSNQIHTIVFFEGPGYRDRTCWTNVLAHTIVEGSSAIIRF